jgi:hypothetical protein
MTPVLWALGAIAAITTALVLGYHAAGILPCSP